MKRIVLLLLAAALLLSGCTALKKIEVSMTPVSVTLSGDHPTNQIQKDTEMWMGVYDSKLFFRGLSNNTGCANRVCVLENGSAKKLLDTELSGILSCKLLACVDQHLYYMTWEDFDAEGQLFCFDLETRKSQLLHAGDVSSTTQVVLQEDGVVLFSLWNKPGQFLKLRGDEILGAVEHEVVYPLGERNYTVEDNILTCTYLSESGEDLMEEVFKFPVEPIVIPYADGLLLYCEDCITPVIFISPDGKQTPVFTAQESKSVETAISLHGMDVYVSIEGNPGTRHFGTDDLVSTVNPENGTYRVNLEDLQAEKVSDRVFDSMYNFDDTCLYCADKNGNICRMEFDGSISRRILSNLVDGDYEPKVFTQES